MTRLALVVAAPQPSDGPDAVMCVPAELVGDWGWGALAAETIAAWEAR